MPATARYIDPATGDYEIKNGGPRNDDTPASKVVLRMRTERGSMPGFPTLGSRIHTIPSLTEAGMRLAETYAIECVQDLIDAGEIKETVAVAQKLNRYMHLVLSYVDIQGRPGAVPYNKPVGVG